MAEGDGSSRNFRSAYYEKLGFCGNDEKNYLDLLIASSLFDLDKLNGLFERSELDRNCIETWKVLLGVECDRLNPFDGYANVKRIRAEHFESLRHHVEVLLEHNEIIKRRVKVCSNGQAQKNCLDSTVNGITEGSYEKALVSNEKDTMIDHSLESQSQPHATLDNILKSNNSSTSRNRGEQEYSKRVNAFAEDGTTVKGQPAPRCKLLRSLGADPGKLITLMYLLEAGQLDTTDIDSQLDSEYCRKLSGMARFFANVSHDLQEAFFLFRNFTNNTPNKS